ncbi:MAG: class I SAM-dependent DNA methyltransferase, partial [Aeriscardovia sp.]|nr:class I SAM-dependent DNA methyltransferase [Aeriscardovia sp.]
MNLGYSIGNNADIIAQEHSATNKSAGTKSEGKIDVFVRPLSLLIEQKGPSVDLDKKEQRQGEDVTPIEQALRYNGGLGTENRADWICTCNFHEFRFYDQRRKVNDEYAARYTLGQIHDVITFIANNLVHKTDYLHVQEDISKRAADQVATIYSALAKQYINPDDPESHRSLATLTVRLVFLMYAENASLLQEQQFTTFIEKTDPDDLGNKLQKLFEVLETPEDQRRYVPPLLNAFPYMDGGLFDDDPQHPLEIPLLTEELKNALLHACDFKWQDVDPVIFGSLMEETLSHDERRVNGMHYTSVANIKKVTEPLIFQPLQNEFDELVKTYTDYTKNVKGKKDARERIVQFHEKLASLQFLDPACGSGNFLTETYLDLRALEDKVLHVLYPGIGKGQGYFPLNGESESLIKVSLKQFHGIELNSFAVQVAKTALWIAQQQALDRTAAVMDAQFSHLPLEQSANIYEGNALQYDWNNLIPAADCDYVMGNPPFIGHQERKQNPYLQHDMEVIYGKNIDVDYCSCWYHKAVDYYRDNPNGQFAFVSTNSITQGKQPAFIFKPLCEERWRISFAHRTFAWDSQSSDKAHVHVVIIGMDTKTDTLQPPVLYTYHSLTSEPTALVVKHINPYLLDTPDIWITTRKSLLSSELSSAFFGSMPNDGGALLLDTRDEYDRAMSDPITRQYVHPYRMGKELINGIDRWCLWMPEEKPLLAHTSQFLTERIEACKTSRLQSPAKATRKLADTPWRFGSPHQPKEQYLAIPAFFTQNREYMTCDYYTPDIIAGNKVYTCVDPTGLNFAIIESRMFMVWQKAVGGRLKSDPGFSNTIVWNNLPLPSLDSKPELRDQICTAGKNILTVRDSIPHDLRDEINKLDNESLKEDLLKTRVNLAYLYDPENM